MESSSAKCNRPTNTGDLQPIGPASKRDIEEAVTRAMGKFLKEHLGEHPKAVSTRILEDTVMVRFREVLPPAEKHMMRQKDGMRMIKDLKTKLIERAAPLLKQMIKTLTGAEVVYIHSSFNPETGEYIEIFNLNGEIRA